MTRAAPGPRLSRHTTDASSTAATAAASFAATAASAAAAAANTAAVAAAAAAGARVDRLPTGSAPAARPGVAPAAAEEFLRRFYAERPAAIGLGRRLRTVHAEIEQTGSYWHTTEELEFGARVAWRNSARCIGRLYWRSLRIRDQRAVRDPAGIAAAAVEHLRIATNGGRIRPLITIFAPDAPDRPGPRIWNEQLVRYAGYCRPDGTVLGDPRLAGFTALAQRLGWAGAGTAFDVLPLVIGDGSGRLRLFRLPTQAILEVPLSHPHYPWFAELGLRWYAVPVISNMCLEIGGICYQAAPFNGWYMGTEIGARNLADTDRYDLLPTVAQRLGLATDDERNLWRDLAMVELNVAVLHSFDAAGVTITDHHTESRRFLTHLDREARLGRSVPADWSWIVPPMSGAATPVFHRYYDQADLRPTFVLHDDAAARAAGCPGTEVASQVDPPRTT